MFVFTSNWSRMIFYFSLIFIATIGNIVQAEGNFTLVEPSVIPTIEVYHKSDSDIPVLPSEFGNGFVVDYTFPIDIEYNIYLDYTLNAGQLFENIEPITIINQSDTAITRITGGQVGGSVVRYILQGSISPIHKGDTVRFSGFKVSGKEKDFKNLSSLEIRIDVGEADVDFKSSFTETLKLANFGQIVI